MTSCKFRTSSNLPTLGTTALLILALFAFSCKNKSIEQSENEQAAYLHNEPEGAESVPSTPFYLQGIYATSTATHSSVRNLIDRDTATHWESHRGAGPGEGIMLYCFQDKDNYIGRLEIESAIGPGLARIKEVSIYVNGRLAARSDLNGAIIIEENVHTLYIRINRVGEEHIRKFVDEEHSISVNTFPSTYSVGLKRLDLLAKDEKPYHLIAPRQIQGTLSPSSNLNPMQFYHAGKLFDSRRELAWIEGSEGWGRGDSILIRLEVPVTITAIQIWNGYQRSERDFNENARLKSFAFGPLHKSGIEYLLKDTDYPQMVILEGINSGSEFVFKITDVFQGGSFRDLAISELLFFDGEKSMLVESGLSRHFEQEIRDNVVGTILESLLDRTVYNEIQSPFGDVFTRQSLILHSDGSFLLYKEEYSSIDNKVVESKAAGNWQLLEAGKDVARIKLSGKMTRLDDSTSEPLQELFNDELHIHAGLIEGSGLAGKFYDFRL